MFWRKHQAEQKEVLPPTAVVVTRLEDVASRMEDLADQIEAALRESDDRPS